MPQEHPSLRLHRLDYLSSFLHQRDESDASAVSVRSVYGVCCLYWCGAEILPGGASLQRAAVRGDGDLYGVHAVLPLRHIREGDRKELIPSSEADEERAEHSGIRALY